MEELFELLLNTCIFNNDVLTIEQACTLNGLNYERILEHAIVDSEASDQLKLACMVIKGRIKDRYFDGSMSKNQADELISESDDILEVYLNVSTKPVDENSGD